VVISFWDIGCLTVIKVILGGNRFHFAFAAFP